MTRWGWILLTTPIWVFGAGCGNFPKIRNPNPPSVQTIASIGDQTLPAESRTLGGQRTANSRLYAYQNEGLITGKVTDDYGIGVANAVVRLGVGRDDNGRVVETKADENGRFSLAGLESGQTYNVIAESQSGNIKLTGQVKVRTPDRRVRIVMNDASAKNTATRDDAIPDADADSPITPNNEITDRPIGSSGGDAGDDFPPNTDAPPKTSTRPAPFVSGNRPRATPRDEGGFSADEPLAGDEPPDVRIDVPRGLNTPARTADPLRSGSPETQPAREPWDAEAADSNSNPKTKAKASPAPSSDADGTSPGSETNTNPNPADAGTKTDRKTPADAQGWKPAKDWGVQLQSWSRMQDALDEQEPVRDSQTQAQGTRNDRRATTNRPRNAAFTEAFPGWTVPGSHRVTSGADVGSKNVGNTSDRWTLIDAGPVRSSEKTAAQPVPGKLKAAADDVPETSATEPFEPVRTASASATASAKRDNPSSGRKRWGDIAWEIPTERIAETERPSEENPSRIVTPVVADSSTSPARTEDLGTAQLPAEIPRDDQFAAASCHYDPVSLRLTDFQLPNLRGETVSLADLQADLILLEFWGTWCPPCQVSVPHLAELQNRYGPDQLRVVGIAYEEGSLSHAAAAVVKAARNQHIPYTLLLGRSDGTCPLSQALNIQRYPTRVLLDRTGRILWRDQGAKPDTLQKLDKVIASLLKRKSPAANKAAAP